MRRYKPRKRCPPEHRLLLFLAAAGGSLTAWQISRHCADGRLLPQSRDALKGLIIEETSYSGRTKRPVRRITLTLQGWGVVNRLKPAEWEIKRPPVETLKELVLELAAEGDAWALKIGEDATAADEWRLHQRKVKDGNWMCEAKKPKVKRLPNSGSFKPGDPRIAPLANQFRKANSPLSRPTITTPTVPAESHIEYSADERKILGLADWHCRQCTFCERCHANSDLCLCGTLHVCGRETTTTPTYFQGNLPNIPTAQDTPSDSGLFARIKAAGYQVNSAGEVQYGGRWIPATDWVKKMGHVKL